MWRLRRQQESISGRTDPWGPNTDIVATDTTACTLTPTQGSQYKLLPTLIPDGSSTGVSCDLGLASNIHRLCLSQ